MYVSFSKYILFEKIFLWVFCIFFMSVCIYFYNITLYSLEWDTNTNESWINACNVPHNVPHNKLAMFLAMSSQCTCNVLAIFFCMSATI